MSDSFQDYDLICYGLEPTAVLTLRELTARGWKVLGLRGPQTPTLLYPDPEGWPVEGLWHGYPSPLAQCSWAPADVAVDGFPTAQVTEFSEFGTTEADWRCTLTGPDGESVRLRSRWWVDSVPNGPLHRHGYTKHRQLDDQSRCQWSLRCGQKLDHLRLLTLAEGWAALLPGDGDKAQLLWTGSQQKSAPDLDELIAHPEFAPFELKGDGEALHYEMGCSQASPMTGLGWALTDQATGVAPLFAPQPFQEGLALALAEALSADPRGRIALLGHYSEEVRDHLSRSQKQLAYCEADSEDIGAYWTRKPRASDVFELRIDGELNFDCEMCAKCCSGFSVKVEERLREPIKQFYMELPVEKQPLPEPFGENSIGNVALLQTERGCVFLKEDKLCRIHSDLAENKKPVACRMFPFSFTQTPEGITATPSFACTSVQKGSGRSLEAHREQLEQLAREYRSHLHLPVPIELVLGFHFSTDGYRAMLAALEAADDLPAALRSVATKLGRWVVEGGDEPVQWSTLETFPDEDLIRFWTGYLLEQCCDEDGSADPDHLHLVDFGWDGSLEELQSLPQLEDFESHRDRYLKGLLRSDGLLTRGQVLGSLLIYLGGDQVLAALTRLYARQHNRAPQLDDLYKGLTMLEGRLISHCRPPGFTAQATAQFLDSVYLGCTANV